MAPAATLVIPADHPAFAGHFPARPIVPGVVLLDAALHAVQQAAGLVPGACRIASAKFFHPVGPGASLTIRHEATADGVIRFDISEGTRKVASGTLQCVSADGSGHR